MANGAKFRSDFAERVRSDFEWTNAWLGNFRRLVVRYGRSITIYGAFFHIVCLMDRLTERCAIAANPCNPLPIAPVVLDWRFE
jgi:hypothetical protein